VQQGWRTYLHVLLGELNVVLRDPRDEPVAAEIAISRAGWGEFYSVLTSEARVPLPTGTYTVTVRLETSPQPIAYVRSLPVRVGQMTRRQVTLDVGKLRFRFRQRGRPAGAFVDIAPIGQPEMSLAAGWTTDESVLTLPPGVYRIRLSGYTEQSSRLWLENVRIRSGEQTTLNVELGQGELRVLSTATDGSPFSGQVTVYPARARTPVVAEGTVGTPFILPVGTYDIQIESDLAPYPLWIWDVTLREGQQVEVQALYPQARLYVQVTTPLGLPLAGYVRLHPADTLDVVLREGYAPVRWVVPPGRYRISATELNPLGTTITGDPFLLEEGTAFTYTLEANLGLLVVQPVNADRVSLYLFTGDEGRFLGQLSAALPQVYLLPGRYRLRVEDAQDPSRQVWLEDVQVAEGRTRVLTVRLPERIP